MGRKIVIANIIFVVGGTVGCLSAILLTVLSNVPFFVGVLLALLATFLSWLIGYFISRCPYCHMPLHAPSGSYLFDYCPYCGKHF